MRCIRQNAAVSAGVLPEQSSAWSAGCRSPFCHAVVRKNVVAVFAGEIAGEPTQLASRALLLSSGRRCQHTCLGWLPWLHGCALPSTVYACPPRPCPAPLRCLPAAWPGHDQVAEHHDSFVRGEPLPVEDDADWLVRGAGRVGGPAGVNRGSTWAGVFRTQHSRLRLTPQTLRLADAPAARRCASCCLTGELLRQLLRLCQG
jgi:hypothetical protein